jgi:hypothetical protein
MHVIFRVVLITSAILLCSCQKKSISDFSAEPPKPPVTGDLSQNKITTSEYKEVWMMRGKQGIYVRDHCLEGKRVRRLVFVMQQRWGL